MIAPITRVRRKDSTVSHRQGGVQTTVEGWSCQSGVPIAQTDKQVLVVINNHFLNGSKSLECLLGERSTLKGSVVATDPVNDLALVVAEKGPDRWELAKMATEDVVDGTMETIGYPKDGPLRVYKSRVTGLGKTDRRFIGGESGGPVFQNNELVGIISARTATVADLQRSGQLTPDAVAGIAHAERNGDFGTFVPVTKVDGFVREAAVNLALDYPVFTQFFTDEGGNGHESPLRGN